MKFEISKSLYGEEVLFIARDSSGNVRFREPTLKELQKRIEEFNKPKEEVKPEAKTNGDQKPKKKKFLFNRLGELIRAR